MKIIMQYQEDGIEEGETPEIATIREIKEELGIDVSIDKLIYLKEEIIENKENKKQYFYLCNYIGGEFGTGDGPEFNNDPKYINSGNYIPEIIKKEDIKDLFLLPPDFKLKLLQEIKEGNL